MGRPPESAYEALSAIEQCCRRLLHASCDGSWIIDAEGKITFANPRMAEMLGYAVQEMQGRNLVNFIDKKWQSSIAQTLEHCKQGISEKHDFELNAKGGSVLWVTFSTNPLIDKAGLYSGCLAMVADISERKKTEESLLRSKSLLELHVKQRIDELESLNQVLSRREAELKEAQRVAHVGSWVWEPQTNKVTWSEEIYRIFGRDPKLPPPDSHENAQAFTPESKLRLKTAIDLVLRTGAPYELDLEVVRPDGTRRWITSHGEAEYDAAGQVIKIHGTAQDITGRKTIETALRESEEALRENEAMFRSFFDSAGGMRGIVELVEEDILHISDNAVAAIFHGQTKASMRLKRESELGVPPTITRIWIQHLVESQRSGAPVAFDYANQLADGGHQWLFATVSYLGLSTEGHPRFAYVTTDITLKKEMEAAVQRAKRMESLATLTNGIARDLNNIMAPVLMIAPLLRDKVADVESRHFLDTLETNALRGADIIKQLMVFGLGRPALEGMEPVADVATPEMPPHGRGELILLAEDEPAVREVLRETLLTFGYRVVTANNGSEAQELYALRRKEILAVITDLAMPVMDGLALTRALKEMDPAVKIIVSTGMSQKSQRIALQKLGVQTFLDKPYMAGPMLIALQKELGHKS